MADGSEKAESETAFRRVVDYFLGHEKPKDEPGVKPKKRPTKTAKKPSTKPKKRD